MKKSSKPAERKRLAEYAKEVFGLSIRQACKLFWISRTMFYYDHHPRDDSEVIDTLTNLVKQYPRYGFDKLFALIQRADHPWNHKRVHRVYCKMKLNIRRKHKKRLKRKTPQPLLQPLNPNYCWSMDFMQDSLSCGRRFRTFNLVDDYNREGLGIDIGTSLPAQRIIRFLNQLIYVRGKPKRIRSDNGTEATSYHFQQWAKAHDIEIEFIQPGKPMQNGFIERFNGTYRREVLDAYLFSSLDEVRKETQRWLGEYNTQRPHQSFGNLTPVEFLISKGHRHMSLFNW